MPSKNKSKVPTGTVLEGKFRITQEIGRGGMAAVYEAENIDIGKRVAVKILAQELITSKVVRERFIREARATAKIRSPYICDVYDVGMFEERPFLVMELLEGESLYDLMTRVRRLDTKKTLKICTHVARGLDKAHGSGVVHRDMKPENVFLTKGENDRLIAKILDFGLAKFYEPTGGDAESARLTREGALFGTPAYMSPEQAKGQGQVDHRADLWALGCIVYECLTGKTVWNVEQGVAMILAQIAGASLPVPSRVHADVPRAFDEWFKRALHREADKRFQTAREFADSLALALDPTTEAPVSVLTDAESVLQEAARSEPHPPVPAEGPSQVEGKGAGMVEQATRATTGQESSQLTPTAANPPEKRGRGLLLFLGLAAACFAGYGAWIYRGDLLSQAEVSTGPPLKPAETEPFALQIASAQGWLSRGSPENAVKMFREAFKNNGSEVARALMINASLVAEENKGPCRLTGLGRPRPFSDITPASRPTIARTRRGTVFGWIDNHKKERKKQGFAAVLDATLQRVSPARLITPESSVTRHLQLTAHAERLIATYWEGAGEAPGVYVRALTEDGRISGPGLRVSDVGRSDYYPSLTIMGDGYLVVWSEGEGETRDLVMRRLDSELKPLAKPALLSQHVAAAGDKALAGKPDVAISRDGKLNIVFEVEGRRFADIWLLELSPESADFASGLKRESAPKKTRHLGDLVKVSQTVGKHGQPRIRCGEACFIAWDEEGSGAHLALMEGKKRVWQREIAQKGARPGLGPGADGATALVWFEEGRVRHALVTRDGLGAVSILGRVGGYQPYPAVVAGEQPGDWYVAWRAYEAGHLEAFVAQVACQGSEQ